MSPPRRRRNEHVHFFGESNTVAFVSLSCRLRVAGMRRRRGGDNWEKSVLKLVSLAISYVYICINNVNDNDNLK